MMLQAMVLTELPIAPGAAAQGRIAVIAGGGALPVAVVRTLLAKNEQPLVAIVAGEAVAADFADADCFTIEIEDLAPLMARLRKEGVGRVVLAGNIERRPRLFGIKWSLRLLKSLPRAAAGLFGGDDKLLRAVIGLMEANQIHVVGAHEVTPDLLTPAGVLTRHAPDAQDRRDIHAGAEAARAIGLLDIGQAAIAIGGRAIALEGIEGTDGLLERTTGLRDHGRLAGKTGGALVKCFKPHQDRRADLPAIGPDTVSGATAAGLSGIALDAGRTFILDFDRTIAAADAAGLYIVGIAPQENHD